MESSEDRGSTRVLVRTLGAILDHARTLQGPHTDLGPRPWDSLTDWLPAVERYGGVEPDPWITSQARFVDIVHRGDLNWGDSLFVTTKNSTYCINSTGRNWFVWGGWFERHGHVPAIIGINGCTWGGSVIHSDILAAPGLFLEFANGVTTTRIRSALLVPAGCGARFGA